MSQETKAKEEQLASMATAKADLESLAEEREAQLDASRRAGEKKEQELQAMLEETKQKEARLAEMHSEKEELEKAAAEREAQLEESRRQGEQKEVELQDLAIEKAALENDTAERSAMIKGLLSQYGTEMLDEQSFNSEWCKRCEENGGSWGERNGFRAAIFDGDPVWECMGCDGSYFANHLDPKKEEFWGTFECCDADCKRASMVEADGSTSPGSPPSRGASQRAPSRPRERPSP